MLIGIRPVGELFREISQALYEAVGGDTFFAFYGDLAFFFWQ